MQVHQNYNLKEYNTFGIEIYTKFFSRFSSVEDIRMLLEGHGKIQSKMILGGGSNMLFTKNYDGLILKNEIRGIDVVKEDENHIYIRAGAGVNWHSFVLFCVSHNLGGVENLSLIPGNAGASPMQNIGAYGVEIKDVFYELEAFHLNEKFIKKFSIDECEFGYRESIFKKKLSNQYIILNVTYRLNKIPVFNISYGAIEEELRKMNIKNLSVKAISDAVVTIRTGKLPDPKIIGNAGSFFKNPQITIEKFNVLKMAYPDIAGFHLPDGNIKLAAGWLIEQCGWKGYRKGNAGCYEKQALVLVNYGKATGKEIYDLSEEIKLSVMDKFGITMEREVNII